MRTTTLGIVLALMPALLGAQGSAAANGQAQANTRTAAQVNAGAQAEVRVPREFSPEGRVRLEAIYKEARARGTSEAASERRVSEGRAKGASEAQVIAAAGKYHAQMNATQNAMIKAGRERPAPDEVERGANAMARGVTTAQIETMTRRAPNERSLVVAFEVLTDLTARGVPATKAVTQVQGQLDARASDAALRRLGASATGAVDVNAATRGGAVSATGAVGGVLKRGGGH